MFMSLTDSSGAAGATGPSLLCQSECSLLADLQHAGADVEADTGEELLLTESWDVTAHLFGGQNTENTE